MQGRMAHTLICVLAILALVGSAAPAHAEPVTAIFTAIFTAALNAAGFYSTTLIGFTITASQVASVIAAVTTTAIGIGLTMLLSKRPKPPAPEDAAGVIQQPIPFRQFAYGSVRTGGAVMLFERVDNRLCKVLALFGHRIHSFGQLYLNDDAVTMEAGPATLTGPKKGYIVKGEGNRYVQPHVAIDTRYGLDTETAYEHVVEVMAGDNPGIWGVGHRGDGIASLMMVLRKGSDKFFSGIFPFGAPQPSIVCETALLFDPRVSGHDPDDPDTWEYSRNCALAMLHFQCFSEFGYKRDYATAIVPVLDRWIQAADDCDEPVAKKTGGTEPRYQLGFQMTAEQDRKVAVGTILAACDGWLCHRGDGTVVMDVGVYREPIITLTDADIKGFRILTDQPSRQRINQSVARYTSIDNNYVSVETDPIIDTADQLLRPGPPRAATLDVLAVQSVGQASRLHKRETIRQRARRSGTLTLRWSALDACYARRVRIQSNMIPGLENAVIENRKPMISAMTQTCVIDFIQVGEEIDEYDPATDESSPAPVAGQPNSRELVPPTGVDARAIQITDGAGNSTIILEVEFDDLYDGETNPPERDYVVRWREDGADAYVETTYTDLTAVAGVYTVRVGVVPPETTLNVSVASISSRSNSEWSTPDINVDTTATGVAPSPPTAFTAVGFTGGVDLQATMPTSAGADSIQFYISASGLGFGLATPAGPRIYDVPGAVVSYSHAVLAGTYDFYAVALNSYGVPSTAVGPESAEAELLFDFTTATLDPDITFTRASVGSRFNSSGVLVSEAVDAERFDYNSATLALRGLLLEPATPNISPRARYAAGWTLSGASASGTVTSLWGDSISALLASGSAVVHRALCSLTVESLSYVGGDVYTYSFDAMLPSGSDTIAIWARVRTSLGGQTVRFSLSGSTWSFLSSIPFGTNPPPAITASSVLITPLASGWVRFEIRSQVSSVNTTFTQMDVGWGLNAASESAAGTANTTIALDNFNVVKTSTFGLSRIITTAGAVTRAADVAKFTPAAGVDSLRITFDDNSTQDVSVTPLVEYTIPTNLNRPHIKSIAIIP